MSEKPNSVNDLENQSDGAYCKLFQRRISRTISRHIYKYTSANFVTFIGFVIGLLASLCFLYEKLVLAVALSQVFGIISCVDGETARLRNEVSKLGDYYDTIVDRIAEICMILSIVIMTERKLGTASVYKAGIWYMVAVFFLTMSAEKFRSTFRINYPKMRLEKIFIWISAGSDARILNLGLISLIILLIPDFTLIVTSFQVFGLIIYLNIFYRFYIIWKSQLNNEQF